MDEEEDSWGLAARLHNLSIETTGTDEETAEAFTSVQEMEVEEGRGGLV